MRPQTSGLKTRRAAIVFIGFGVVLLGIMVRLFWIQTVQAPALARAAQAIHLHTVPIPAQRGRIIGRNGAVLAVSVPAYSVYADPKQITDPAKETAKLAPLLQLPAQLVQRRLAAHSQFVWVYQGVSPKQANAIRALHLTGIYLRSTTQRRYPQGMLLGHVLGFVGLAGKGLDGVELWYNKQLAGRAGYAREHFDALGNPLPGSRRVVRQPRPGLTLQLNVDAGLQFDLQRYLDAQVALTHAKEAWGVVTDPATGAVLALGSWPTFDPNHFASAAPKLWTDPVVSGTFPPGSIFKPVTAVTALTAHVVSPTTPFTDPGVLRVDGVPLHNFQHLEVHTDFTRAFEESANVVFGHVGLMIGKQRFYEGLKNLGLLGPTHVDLPGESAVPNILRPERLATPLTVAEMSFGESLAVTPLSLMMALDAGINGGRLVEPRVARALLAPDGTLVKRFAPKVVRQAIPASVSAELRKMMVGVVRYGTGQRGFIPCYNVGGKTGTSNIYQGGKTLHGKYYASFFEFAPVSKPRVAVLVTIVDPKGAFNEGGEVAAPVAQAVLRSALHLLDVPAHCTVTNRRPPAPGSPGGTALMLRMVNMPAIVGLTPKQARLALLRVGVYLKTSGAGSVILRQNPPSGAMVQKYTTVEGYTHADVLQPGTLVTVPDLSGATLEHAASRLSQLGLNLDSTGVGTVHAQSPPAGTQVPVGSSVHATLS